MVKHFVAAVAAIAVSFSFAIQPAGAADAPAAAGPYVVTVVLPLTGEAAALGADEAASLHALESTVNAHGGVRGRSVHFAIEDDASDPQTAVHLVDVATGNGAPVVVGPSLTATCGAVSPVVDPAGPPVFCLAPTIAPRAGGFTFASAPSVDDAQRVLFRYLVSHKLLRVAIITTTDTSGADFDARVAALLAQPEFKSLTMVAHEHFAPSDADVSAQMARIAAATPDVLLTFSVGTPFATVLRDIRTAGLNVPVVGAGGNFSLAQIQQFAPLLPGQLLLEGVRGIATDPLASGAQKSAQDAYAGALASAGVHSDLATAIAWDPMMIVLEAVKRAGTDAGAEKIEATLEGLRGFTGIEGTYDFTTHDQRGIGDAAAAVFRYDAASSGFVQVYPVKR
jgi:branched-chain amino acid transport system substrate-binding protein